MAEEFENGMVSSDEVAITDGDGAIGTIPFRRGRGPQGVGRVQKPNQLNARRPPGALVTEKLRLPRTTTARGVRRAHARLCEWVLQGKLDSLVATRISFILENIRKAIDTEQIAWLHAEVEKAEKLADRYGIDLPPIAYEREGDGADSVVDEAATQAIGGFAS
jgi:hypothetical protein